MPPSFPSQLLLSLSLFLSLSSFLVAQPSPSLQNFTVEYLSNPLAVDIDWNPSPRFAWIVANAEQVSYQITVINTFTSAIVWYSGIVTSSSTSQIPYAGTGLLYDTDYLWYVNVTLQSSNPSYPFLLSPNQTFTTSPNSTAFALNPWIGGCTVAQQSPQLRYNFTLPSSSPIVRARAYVTGLGIYTFYVNGVRPNYGNDVLTPGWSTVTTARVLANAYDILPFLSSDSENVFGLRLGQGKYGYAYFLCTAGDATCYAGNVYVVITQANGKTTTISSSTDWTCSPSPIVFNHLFGGETFNASLDQPGWNAPNFQPLVPWTNVDYRYPNVSLISTGGPPPIQIMHNLTAVNITIGPSSPVLAGGEFVISSSSPNVWWVANNSGIKNFVTECQPCPAINACGNLHNVPESFIDSLTQGANFSCSMLPNSTSSSPYIFDFGRNMAGLCTLTLPPSPPSTMISLAHGEILDTAGNVDNTFGASSPPRTCNVNVINCADQMDQYIFGNDGLASYHTYTPSFTFHGFRYIALFGWPSNTSYVPDASTIVCHQAYTGLADNGNVSFNRTDLNNIQAAIVRTQKSNLFSIPSDCPTRERRPWMGDAQVSSSQAVLNLHMAPLYENFARSHSDTVFMSCWNPSSSPSIFHGSSYLEATLQSPVRPAQYLCCGNRNEFGCEPGLTPLNATGSLPDVVPFDAISGFPGDFVWEVAGEVIPYNTFKQENNVPYLQLLWPFITNHLEFASTNAVGSNGLIQFGPYADWLATEGVSRSFAENWYYLLSITIGAELATALGHTNQAIAYTALANTISSTLVQTLFNASSGTWDGSGNMNAQAMALAVNLGGNLISPNQTQSIVSSMVNDCTNHGYHPTCGVSSCRYLFQGIVNGNVSSLAFDVVTVPTSPSWAYMAEPIMPGTIWESWDGDEHHSDGSKNHPMLTGGIGVWMYEYALGLRFAHKVRANANAQPSKDLPELFASTTALGFDPRTYGLNDDETVLALRLSQRAQDAFRKNREVQAWGIHDYLTELSKMETIPSSSSSVRSVVPMVTIIPDPAIVMRLGTAQGYHQTPYGRSTLEWTYDTVTSSSFTLTSFIPSGGVQGRFGIPLGLVYAMVTKNLSLSLTGGTVVNMKIRTHTSIDGDVSTAGTVVLDSIIHLTATVTENSMKHVRDRANCSMLGTTDNGRYMVTFCSVPVPPTPDTLTVHQRLTYPRLVTYTEMEDLGRLHFAGEPDRTPTITTSYIYMQSNWGKYGITLSTLPTMV